MLDVLLKLENLTKHQRKVLECLKKNGGNKSKTAEELGIKRQAVISALMLAKKKLINADAAKNIYDLQEENKALKKKLKELEKSLFTGEDIREFIINVRKEKVSIPEWISKPNPSKGSLVPVMAFADWHVGEVVNADEVHGKNEYNKDISKHRINALVDDFIDICANKLNNYKYAGVVVPIMGDIITGSLHDLPETNDLRPIKQVVFARDLIIQQIEKFKKVFGKVFVPAVTGNHGRLSHKRTKTKGRTDDSLETILLYFVQEHYADDTDVTIYFNESDENYFSINGRIFNQQHGDKYRGGNGIGGIHVPIKRGRAKLLESSIAMGKSFDTMIIGHFHQHYIGNDLIICDSPKGYDEFCKAMNIPYSKAGATMFFVNSHGDIIYATNLKVRDEKPREFKKHIEIF